MKINSILIKNKRGEKNWSQEEMAIASGLSLRTVQRAEAEATASLQTVKALAGTLELNANEIKIGGDNKIKQGMSHGWKPLRHGLLLGVMVGVLALGLVLGSADKDSLFNGLGFGGAVNEKILGRWAAQYKDGWLIVSINPSKLQAEGAIYGESEYLLQQNQITYVLRGEIQKAQVTLNDNGSMTWIRTDSGDRIHFNRILDKELTHYILGHWQSTDGDYTLTISADRLVLRSRSGTSISSNYILGDQGKIRFNGQDRRIEHHDIVMSSKDEMTWLRAPMHSDAWTFARQ